MTDLSELSAVALLQKYRDKALSPVEYFDWLEKHIAVWEPKLQALYLYRPEVGRAEAKAAAALGQGCSEGSARRRAGHGEGVDRDQGRSGAARFGRDHAHAGHR